jgi:hypothetical protein
MRKKIEDDGELEAGFWMGAFGSGGSRIWGPLVQRYFTSLGVAADRV